MKRLFILIVLVLATAPALAEKVFAQGGDEIRIFDSPCVSVETMNRMPANARAGWNKAQGSIGGQRFFGCWREMTGVVYIIWEDGDQGVVPMIGFKEATEI